MFDFIFTGILWLVDLLADLALIAVIGFIDLRLEKRIEKAPLETARATVISKHFGKRIRFQLEDSSRKRFQLSKEMYDELEVNQMGTLSYKKTYFVDFGEL